MIKINEKLLNNCQNLRKINLNFGKVKTVAFY